MPAGRYYIGAGSVSSPTFYPDSPNLASARVVAIAAGTTIENIDFSRYTAASVSPTGANVFLPPPLPPGSTGVLSGVVRNYDGSAASGVSVVAVPVTAVNMTGMVTYVSGSIGFQTNSSVLFTGITTVRLGNGGRMTTTDSLGRYRLETVSPDTYNLAAGFSDSPVFYSGMNGVQKAMAITTTPATLLTTLDFTLPSPAKTYSVKGSVMANQAKPAGGATLELRSLDYVMASGGVASLLPRRSYKPGSSAADGTFEFTDVVPGRYSLQASLSGATSPLAKTVEITDRSATMDFDFQMQVLTGRVVWDDGSAFMDPSVGEVALSTTSNPNVVFSTYLKLSKDGAFSGVIEPGEYRFYVRSLPNLYDVRSITAGAVDLTKEHLVLGREASSDIEIRVAKRSGIGTRVRGKVLNAIPRTPTSAERLELCCFSTGPFERLSTALQSDGSFDFPSIPAGRYSAELRGKTGPSYPSIFNSVVVVGDREMSGLLLLTSAQMTSATASIAFEGSGIVRFSLNGLAVSLTIPATSGQEGGDVTIPMSNLPDGSFWVLIPAGVPYTVSVAGLPEGYRVKSISKPAGTTQIVIEKIPAP
jgi:hypothetical protein